jgi:hypothetical protein
MSPAGVSKAPGRAIRSPLAEAGGGTAAAEPVLVPDARLVVGLPAATPGGSCADNSAESDQHTITRITAKTKAVNPSHTTSPANFGRLGSITGVASGAIIYPS